MPQINADVALARFRKISFEIDLLISSLGENGDYVVVNDTNNADEYLKHTAVVKIMDKLDDVKQLLNYLNKPIRATGHLYKNDLGRYAIDDYNYFTSGSSIEVLIREDGHNEWVMSTVEHSTDYYIVALGKNVNIEGMYCRVR